MNDYNLIFKGKSGSISIIDNNTTYDLTPYQITNIKKPINLYYKTNTTSQSTESLIIQSHQHYYSIIFDESTLLTQENYSYYFLYLNNLLNMNPVHRPSIYGTSILEKSDISNMIVKTSDPQTFHNISLTSTVSKKPTTQTLSYVSSNNYNFLTLFKNHSTLFASCSILNGSNYTSFCGTYESMMREFLLYNYNDTLIHNSSSLEYHDLHNPIKLTINFANSV